MQIQRIISWFNFRQKPFDTVLKAGEWQLGSDIEPLKFDIKRASSIHLHPRYNPQTHENDMAVVFVEAKFKYGGPIDHVSSICLDESDITVDERCVTLGWGETALACKSLTKLIDIVFY